MTIAFWKRLALTLVVVAAPWAFAGCGDSGSTSIPATTPPPPAKNLGPPTAAAGPNQAK